MDIKILKFIDLKKLEGLDFEGYRIASILYEDITSPMDIESEYPYTVILEKDKALETLKLIQNSRIVTVVTALNSIQCLDCKEFTDTSTGKKIMAKDLVVGDYIEIDDDIEDRFITREY